MVGFQNDSIFGEAGSQNTGKSDSSGSAGANPSCPHCGSKKVWRDGHWLSVFGDDIQRWLCRDCGLRFSDPNDIQRSWSRAEKITRNSEESLKSEAAIVVSRQICVTETKNLEAEQKQIEIPRGKQVDLKSALVDFIWQLKRQNYSEDTIRSYSFNIQQLMDMKVNLFDPQSFIDKMTELGDKKTNVRKYNLRKAYRCFLNYHHIEATLPKYRFKRPPPYVPPEEFLNQLIASAQSDQMSVLLWALKETAARPGEAQRLEWKDIDIAHKTISISHPEKGCNPRIIDVPEGLINAMLKLPHAKGNLIFNYKNKHACSQSFRRMRKRTAWKLGNPELLKIDFYTFRYWRATEEYDRSHKDFESVMYLLGHNSLRYVLLYKQLSRARKHGSVDKYLVREGRTKKEEIALLEDGFDFVKERGKVSLYRKLKM